VNIRVPRKPKSKTIKRTAKKKIIVHTGAPSLLGKAAPSFVMLADNGESISLSDFGGKRVVLYFYPKDDTPGCTTEALSFNESKATFLRRNAVIVGISKDTVARHSKFKAKYRLKFTLASDANANVCEAYGVWREKKLYGRKYMGIERSTFLVDEKGVVRAEWRKVRVPGHADEVAEVLKSL
jgi:thioredoxin-dependent peroxiredoxin